jgi:hypothetical protein
MLCARSPVYVNALRGILSGKATWSDREIGLHKGMRASSHQRKTWKCKTTRNSKKTYWRMVEAHLVTGGWQACWQIRVGVATKSRIVEHGTESTIWGTHLHALNAGLNEVGRWSKAHGTEEP